MRTLRGWRRELVGEELLELLDGRVSLSVRDGRLRMVAGRDRERRPRRRGGAHLMLL